MPYFIQTTHINTGNTHQFSCDAAMRSGDYTKTAGRWKSRIFLQPNNKIPGGWQKNLRFFLFCPAEKSEIFAFSPLRFFRPDRDFGNIFHWDAQAFVCGFFQE